MPFNMPYSPDIPSEVFSILGVIVAIVLSILAIKTVVFYIFEAVSLYTIAKKRGIANPWISFIPIVNKYMVGAIADNINAYINKRTSYRYLLIILNIVTQVMSIFFYIAYFKFLLSDGLSWLIEDPSMYTQNMLPFMGLSGIVSLVSIAYIVFYFIAMYRIFVDYNQRNAVLFTVLSIFFRGVGLPYFFLFSLRNKPSASLYYAQQMQQNAMHYQPYMQGSGYSQANPNQQPTQPTNPNNQNNDSNIK
ncbi:hypothetical protein RBG61_07545 [Paludicola sp. MB14-C6]|uniref:hypothetical protein n=1 Tax=Paludihabitans sp. MB14-C6 TaxID=3070656 RepID=UPI0027DDAFB0|nr:hypothetical protein [Paludicola sp. MB14-C6]WMJ21858.1 hypothetical protein RBG61_07545 [Paludicola sp. MB14-C6]